MCRSCRLFYTIKTALLHPPERILYTAYSLLTFLDQDTDLTQVLRAELTDEQGRFPSRRTWERRLQALPESLPGVIGSLGRHLVGLIHPWAYSTDRVERYRRLPTGFALSV